MKIKIPHIENYDYISPTFKQYGGDILQQESVGYSISSVTVKNVVSLYYGSNIDIYTCTNDFYANMYNLPNIEEIKKLLPVSPYQTPRNELIEYICKSYVISNNLIQNCNLGGMGLNTIDNIKTMVKRVLSFFNDKKIYMLNKEFYLVDDAIVHIVVSIKTPKIKDSLIKLFDTKFDIKKDELPPIDKFIIFNPRQNNSIEIDFDKNKEFNNQKIKERNKALKEKDNNLINKLKGKNIEISLNDFNDHYNEALLLNNTLKKESFLDSICNLMSLYDCSFEDAYDAYMFDLESGNVRGRNEVRYKDEIYESKMNAYKKLLPKYDAEKVSDSVNQRMRYHNISWEKALEETINNPPKSTGDPVVYKRKKYNSKKQLIEELFPNRKYEVVLGSINYFVNKENISFNEAINKLLSSNNTRGYKKPITYKGIAYKSIRSACKELNLKPEVLSRLLKKYDGDCDRAIDYLMENKGEMQCQK